MNKIAKGFFWKFLEQVGVTGVQFVLQIIMARLLAPEHYGVLSIMLVFVNLATVFVQRGFNTSLIQNPDVTEEDYSSVFWVSLGVSVVAYGVVFLAAPVIGKFYNMPDLVSPLRVLALVLLPGSFNSVQLAKVNREMDFKKVFLSNIGGCLISGLVGAGLAYAGAGLWALVAQSMTNMVAACLVMLYTVKWFPRFVINWQRIRVLFSFGWKLLASSLLDTLYQNVQSLVIGKKYDEGTLGFHDRGKHFPQSIVLAVNDSVHSVMLPAISEKQDDLSQVKSLTRTSIMLSSYIMMPVMAGLAGVATPLVSLLLTDKWLPCVPYLQIYCFSQAFYPVHSCNLQAINAMGRSDVFLKLEIAKKAIGLSALVVAVFCFESPLAIAMTSVFTTFTSCFINAYPNKKLIGYSYLEQMRDILPALLCSITMCCLVLAVQLLQLNTFLTLVIQVPLGVAVYVGLSVIFKLEAFWEALQAVKNFLSKKEREK